jgi:dTDP-glucose 4,6-dehydratase
MRCLITGIGGSIGVHVMCHVMHNTDWDVVGLDSFRHRGWTDRIEEALLAHDDWRPRLTVLRHDLCAPISPVLQNKIGHIDYVINLASLSDVFASIQDPVPFVRNNVDIILNMLEWARIMKPRVFLQVSTDEVYGPTDGQHMHKEWDPIVPSNPYSGSKAAQEAIAISYWRSYNVPLVLVNLMNNFGEMQSSKKFPAIVQHKLMKGETITVHGSKDEQGSRHYIHSRNTADAFLHVIEKLSQPPHLHVNGVMDKPDRYNIVGHAQIANDDLATMIGDFMGKPVKINYESFGKSRPGHDRHYGLDGAKLWATGWRAPVSFEVSMRETVRWQQEHPEWLEPKS